MGCITVSARNVFVYKNALKVFSDKLTIVEFANLIGKSYRQAQRILNKIKTYEIEGTFHGNKGRAPLNKTPPELENLIVELLTTKYFGFNLTHFKEQISENENLEITKDTIYRIARRHNLIFASHRRGKKNHAPRPRLPREGMLVQFDGSEHVWFGDHKTDLILAVDDATGKILNAEFFYGEKSMHSMKVIRDLIEIHGIPEAFYMDQAGIYGKRDIDWESQIARAFGEINIRLILAGSAQAKGRVERTFRTLQDRLIAELSLHQIRTITEANEYLKNIFIDKFNQQFAIAAHDLEKSYRQNVFGNLERVFCKKVTRKIGGGNVFSWDGITWAIDEDRCFAKRFVNINIHIEGNYTFDIMGRKVQAKVLNKKRSYNIKKTVNWNTG